MTRFDEVELRSGNLGVDLLMKVARGEPRPSLEDRCRDLDLLAELGFDTVEDYVGWWALEPEEGRVDAEPFREHAREAARRGLRYAVYPWIHATPPWALARPDWTPFRCLEHDRETYAPSIWAPATRWAFRRVFGILREELGDLVSALYLAGPADYGEVGYPTGMAKWVVQYPAHLDHDHEGLWCGDAYARRSFQRAMVRKHGSVGAARRAWGLQAEGELPMPGPVSSERACFDFQRWYTGSMTRFFRWMARLAREEFPTHPVELRIGHGSEKLEFGQDLDELLEDCASTGVAVRSTQASLSYFNQKRLANPCRHFAIPWASEPMVDRSRAEFVARVFKDASCGVQAFFEYPKHLREAHDLFPLARDFLKRDLPIVDVALFFPSTDHRLRPDQGLPPETLGAATPFRDLFDYDVIDEATIRGGGLEPYRVLIWVGGGAIETEASGHLVQWVRGGGVLFVGGDTPLRRWEGDDGFDEEVLGDLRTRADSLSPSLGGRPEKRMSLHLGTGRETFHLFGDWHGPESAHWFWGGTLDHRRCRWTSAMAGCRLPTIPGQRYRLAIESACPGLPFNRQSEVRWNGEALGSLDRAEGQTWVWEVTASSAVSELSWHSEAFRADEHFGSEDRRLLGLVVKSIHLVEHGEDLEEQERTPPDLWAAIAAERLRRFTREVGDGGVVLCSELDPPVLAAAAAMVVYRLSSLIPGGRDALPLDGEPDGVLTTLFERRVLLLNTHDRERVKTIRFEGRDVTVTLAPHALGEIDRESLAVRTLIP